MAVYIGSTAGYLRLDSWVLSKIAQLSVNNFCRRYFNRDNDPCGRQFDQTVQAIRAVPANIAEGSARHQTSVETEMRLLDVARASLSEVVEDLMFVLMDNGRTVWDDDDTPARAVRDLRLSPACYGKGLLHDASAHVLEQNRKFEPWVERDDLMVPAKARIVICQRIIRMLRHQIEARLKEFEEQGGFTENMTDTRLQAKRQQNEAQQAPRCPKCGAVMVRRMAKKGVNAGHEFWSCSNFSTTGCNGALPIT